MPKYLMVADKVFKNVQNEKYFMENPVEDFNTLMLEIRKAMKGTNLKLRYLHIDFDNLVMSNLNSKINLDASLIPKIQNHQEFILWLAGFIEKITECEKTDLPPALLSVRHTSLSH